MSPGLLPAPTVRPGARTRPGRGRCGWPWSCPHPRATRKRSDHAGRTAARCPAPETSDRPVEPEGWTVPSRLLGRPRPERCCRPGSAAGWLQGGSRPAGCSAGGLRGRDRRRKRQAPDAGARPSSARHRGPQGRNPSARQWRESCSKLIRPSPTPVQPSQKAVDSAKRGCVETALFGA